MSQVKEPSLNTVPHFALIQYIISANVDMFPRCLSSISLGSGHELLVEEALSLGEPAHHHVLILLGHLLLHLHL